MKKNQYLHLNFWLEKCLAPGNGECDGRDKFHPPFTEEERDALFDEFLDWAVERNLTAVGSFGLEEEEEEEEGA